MNVVVLGSGSRGNAVVLEADGARLLVDAGFPARTLSRRLAAAEIAPESIAALVLTHEHGDHVAGACASARKWGWTVYATEGTISGTPGLSALRPRAIAPDDTLALDTFRVRCLRTPHDASDPIAVVVEDQSSGTRVGVAYDLGHAPSSLSRALSDLDALILEANHDEAMLRSGPYPVAVQARIAGATGHLSNRAAAQLARQVAHRGLRHLMLAHLSQHNNKPELAVGALEATLRTTSFRGAVSVAPQDAVVSFTVARGRRVQQLTLF